MPIPILRSLTSVELARPALPVDPTDCAVLLHAEIGPPGAPGGDVFTFTAITPSQLAEADGPRWGRGYLILPAFSWEGAEQAVRRLLMHADRGAWEESARELAKELHWEFEHYTP